MRDCEELTIDELILHRNKAVERWEGTWGALIKVLVKHG
ncbi:hypothetical protein JHL16_17975 [Aestuariivirga sp. YIM B02566]|uniref:Uncharacterized protein n=1 Tax=Taklimakanibacter albus TaxID=2800327 RepID=A0ACC5R6E9_9HYPH|nr:hypothetical protein [Aestuariivirga sp. YIM B02566]